MRGTWQGSGTWQTSGPDFGSVVVLVVAGACVVVAASVVAWILAWLWAVLLVLAACAVLTAVIVLRLKRWSDRQAAAVFAAREPPRLRAEPVAEVPRVERPAIEPPREIHLHLNVTPDQLAAIVRHHLEEDR